MKHLKHLLALCMIFVFAVPVSAQTGISKPESEKIIDTQEINQINPSAVFGQDHAYTVTLRGNGEAIVNARVAFSNFDDYEKTSLSLRVPQGDPQDIVAYQIVREPQCIRYADAVYQNPSKGYAPDIAPCLEYQEPNYYDYWWGKAKYFKAETQLDGDTINFTLPKAVAQNSSGSILLYYRTMGIAQKASFGSFDYRFESLKVKEPIRNITIGVTTDQDMVLRGAESQVQYRFNYSMPLIQSVAYAEKSTFTSTEFDSYVSQIGQGIIVKTATYLQPLDSYLVSGSYAKSIIRLYAKDILKVVGIIIGFFACLIVGAFFIMKRKKPPVVTEQVGKSEGAAHSSKLMTFIWMVIVSFISSLIAAGYTGLVFILTQWMQQWYYYTNSMFVTLLLLVFSLGVYALVIVGPAIFMGVKRGVWSGIGIFFMILLWFMMYIFIGIGFYMMNRAGRGEIYPQPLMYQNEVMKDVGSAPPK
ncbi:MAG: hypothetical protein US54_C0032G0009 [Candidatus Roizmanbacteria bacterium GW2011_GWA2_37_7]|uniref:Uncharacterized protein n=1 Tax=Candidatus Roizmanbacteria bacterium GW2011_GWA2_37_7 TaxID=1618481 RepID=A0A0G0KAA9_9BACT|nr:MAG: hypothetical protein US54_C0032G0009 [Candidatus Roizmanbacteria bacterium GW2011_GWA2_37_7]